MISIKMRGAISSHHRLSMPSIHTSTQFRFPFINNLIAMLTLEFILVFYYVHFSHALYDYQQQKQDTSSSYFEIVHPRIIHDEYRLRRSPHAPPTSHHDKNIEYKFATEKNELHLILTLNDRLISPGFVLERRSSSNLTRSRTQPAYDRHHHCSYHGMVRGYAHSHVAVNVCRGLRGLISLGDDEFFIEPVNASPHGSENDDGSHILYRPSSTTAKRNSTSNDAHCSVKDPMLNDVDESITSAPRSRERKSVSMERTVETLVVVDHTMMEYHKDEDIDTYVLTIMNLVAKFYRDPSIGNLVNIALVRLIFLEDEQEDLDISRDADNTLDSFCRWQSKLISEEDSQIHHHDNAILLTRNDLCRGTGKCGTVGLAHVSGMCSRESSCSVNEDNGLSVGYTVAHEMGHNFGMQHDGYENPCSSYDESRPYVMSERVPGGYTPITWSSCSREYITRFLDSGRGSCLEDSPSSIPYIYPEVLPGVMYSADHQCRLQYGPNSTVCARSESDLCTALWCTVGRMCQSRMTAAAQGTRCGKDKWCISGECIDIDEHPAVIDGGWGPWSEYSECSLSCGRAVKSKERQCNNPSPSHGGKYCVGERKKYALCELKDCDPGSISVRAMQCGNYDRIIWNGTQITWTPHHVEDKPCELFCRQQGKSFIERKANHVIDGTPCTHLSRDICIDGICQMVGCDNVVSSGAVEDRCGVCRGDGSSCFTVRDIFTTKSGRGYVEVTVIPAGARNIVVEEIAPAHNYLAITNGAREDLLNMDWEVEWSGEYPAAGSIISYERIDKKERIDIMGPITEPLHIELIFVGQPNPGITYEYTIPRDDNHTVVIPQSFSWVYSDWSPCSASCGIGYQRSSVICKELIAGLVDDRYCDDTKPDDIQQTCNEQQCPATWWEGPWQHCTGGCGEQGRRQRSVFCIHGSTNGEQVVLDDVDCLSQGQEKPVTEATCTVELQCESNDQWQTGEWSQCSVSCGDGWHTRTVVCTNLHKPCDPAGKPSDRRPCLRDQCPTRPFFYDNVPSAPESQSIVDESSMYHSSASLSISVDYPVNFGEWEKKIAIQKYESESKIPTKPPSKPPGKVPDPVLHELNITTHNIDVFNEQIENGEHLRSNPFSEEPDSSPYVNFILFPSALRDKPRPPTTDEETSRIHQQQAAETTIGWSKQLWQQCSATCGDGIQHRLVECVELGTGHRTTGCSIEDQPASLQSCNLGSCREACTNTLSTTMCQIIVQSGSCSQAHFRDRCCRTCEELR